MAHTNVDHLLNMDSYMIFYSWYCPFIHLYNGKNIINQNGWLTWWSNLNKIKSYCKLVKRNDVSYIS